MRTSLPLLLFVLGCQAPLALVRVESTPPGAAIVLDSLDTGLVTPAELQLDLEQRAYTVECRLEGYASLRQELRLSQEVYTPTEAELWTLALCSPCCLGLPLVSFFVQQQNPYAYFNPMGVHFRLPAEGQGALLEGAAPDATVTLDGAPAGRWLDGSLLVAAAPGPHRLEVHIPGHEPWGLDWEVAAGRFDAFAVAPAATVQGLRLSAAPGTRVLYDGADLGLTETPRELPLPAGPQRLTVVRDGQEEVRAYTVPAGRFLNVHFR